MAVYIAKESVSKRNHVCANTECMKELPKGSTVWYARPDGKPCGNSELMGPFCSRDCFQVVDAIVNMGD